jgi:hypothetical protein
MPILADEKDPSVGRESDEHDRAFVAHDLESPHDRAAGALDPR